MSEGGLCIVAPVRFRSRSTIQVVIEDPRHGPVEVEGVVWHDRPFKQPSSGRKGFATGLVLAKGGADFQALANPRWVAAATSVHTPGAPEQDAAPAATSPPRGDLLELDADGPSVYRVRVKALGVPRIRTLTLSATSEEAAREAVLSGLEGDWQVLNVEVDPLN